MEGVGLYALYETDGVWKPLVCNADGKIIIDPSEIFENVPTDNEHGKAPDSDWAYEHENNASAHHAKYTDAEAVSAVAASDDYLKNDGDTASGDYNFDSNTMFIDSTNNRVGVNNGSPDYDLDVTGQIYASKGRAPSGYLHGNSLTIGDMFDALDPYLPNTGDVMMIFGTYKTDKDYYPTRVERVDATNIRMYERGYNAAAGDWLIEEGSSYTLNYCSLVW